jgi:ATP-binding cassette subfamily B protein
MNTTERVNWPTVRVFAEATLAHKRLFFTSCLQVIAMVGISTVVPFFASRTLSAAIGHGDSFWLNLGWLALVIVTCLIMNRVGFTSLMKLIANVMYELQNKVFAHLMHRGIRFHTDNVGGKLVSDAIDYPSAYNQLINAVFTSGGPLFLALIVGLGIIFAESWPLGLYMLIVIIVTLAWAYRESLTRHTLRTTRLKATKALVSHMSDSIVNAATVKTFAAENREIHTSTSLGRTLRGLRENDWQRAGISGNYRMGFLLGALLGLLLVVYLFVDFGTQSNGLATSIFAFSYTMTLIMRLFDINNLTRQVEEAFLQASPMTQILLEENEIKDTAKAAKLDVAEGMIEFQDVSFAYTDASSGQNVFSKLHLHIKPGEHIGLVGPSGGGKTTLTRLLLRFEDVSGGSILVDGQDIRDVTQSSLRDAIGYVPQEPLLFHRSILENITYGNPAASQNSIKKAATLASAHDFIEKLSNGYGTVVGERGVKLSGGQRQRIAIARAILKNAPILVLDEATSALDSESESLIQDAMFRLMEGKTAVVIAHRLSTIQRLDRIIVMDEGKVIEDGTHSELLKKDGLYARLWRHQSGGFLQEN